MHSFESNTIITNKINLHYIHYHNPGKPKLVLLHGLTANSMAFSGLVHNGINEYFELISPDLRGRGKTDKPAFHYSFREHAKDILGLLDHLQIKKAIIGGHSFGGLLAAFIAYHYPERVEQLILIDAAAELNSNAFDMLKGTLGRLDQIFPSYDHYLNSMKTAKHINFWTDDMEQYYQADITTFEDGTVTPIPSLTNIYRIAAEVATQQWNKIFKSIQQPAILLNGLDNYGEEEPLLPDFKARQTVEMMPNCKYVRIDGNHQTMLYARGAKEIIEAIIDFTSDTAMEVMEQRKYKVAVVGATGVVGSTMIKILEDRDFPVSELVPVASEKSKGKTVIFQGNKFTTVTPEQAINMECDIALFSAGGSTSLQYAPAFAAVGTTVIDNSSAWRMDPKKKLVVPEVNASVLTAKDKIIANPNCSTIQMVAVLKPLHDKYKINRVIVSTYQSVSGSGIKGIQQMESEEKDTKSEHFYPHPIHRNIIPQIDVFLENGYTKEEMKMILETKKIMQDEHIKVTATTVRVPVKVGHSESINIEFAREFNIEDVRQLLSETPGIIVLDDPANNVYPTPLMIEGKDEVYVGRLRRDISKPKSLSCWVAADNLRKGAALNAIQIAEYIAEFDLVKAKELL